MIDQLERRFGRRGGIPQLANILAAGRVVVWVIMMFIDRNLAGMLSLSRAGIMQGQIWRLITFLFLPGNYSPLWFVLEVYFYWFLGNMLERYWGTFRFTLYFIFGTVGCWLATLLVGSCGNSGLFIGLFWAYAWLNPNMQVLLMGIIPLKAKWLGWASVALWLLDWVTASLLGKIALPLEMLGFLIFFGPDILRWVQDYFTNKKRRRDWNDQWKH